jgi:ring-1,2-phenylacetyl-CoA epoxidase subunit PaaE
MTKTLTVDSISYPTPDTVSILFIPSEPVVHGAGQYLALSIPINGVVHSRTYSIHTSPLQTEYIGITIRSITEGLVSNYLFENVQIGMEFVAEGPYGTFTLASTDSPRHLVMIAGGSGITPIFSMIQTALEMYPHTVISLLYANRSHERIIFRQQIHELANKYPGRLSVFHAISDEHSISSDEPVFYKGRLSKLIIKKCVKQVTGDSALTATFYLCGPNGLMTLAEEALSALSIPPETVIKEQFYTPAVSSKLDFDGLPDRDIIIRIKDEERLLRVSTGQSILEAGMQSGLSLRYSCRAGECGTCKAHLVSGQVKMKRNYVLSEEEVNAGGLLLCQSYPMSDDVIISVRTN